MAGLVRVKFEIWYIVPADKVDEAEVMIMEDLFGAVEMGAEELASYLSAEDAPGATLDDVPEHFRFDTED